MERWRWLLRLFTRQLWLRPALFCLFAVLLALLGSWLTPFIPGEVETDLGARSVDNILNLLASSMLAVTTFSLSTMVQAYASATSMITPRAVPLLIDDARSQNALSTFLGSFLFAIVGIIALATGAYGATGRVILFAGTILVILLIIITFLRWIAQIARFGRVNDTIQRIEKAALEAIGSAVSGIRFTGDPGSGAAPGPPPGADPVHTERIGRVTHVAFSDLSELAQEHGARITVAAKVGAFVDPDRPLAWIEGGGEECREAVVDAFTIARERAFDYDFRLSLIALAETGSRALSPATNDPGTAIAVVESGTRVLAALLKRERGGEEREKLTGVEVPPYQFADLLEDLIRPLARDGGQLVELSIRIQKSLHSLCRLEPRAIADCRAAAADAAGRAEALTESEADRKLLSELHQRLWRAG